MDIIKFRNEDYQKTIYCNNYYLLTMIFNNNNNWHQLKVFFDGDIIDNEYNFRWGDGNGRREGIEINYDV